MNQINCIMTRNKWLKIIIGALVVSNALLLVKSVTKHPRPKTEKRPAPKQRIIEALDFDEAQQAKYEETIQRHRNNIQQQDKEIMLKKEQLYALLQAPNDSLKTQYLKELGDLKSAIDNINYEHFLEIKAICNSNQLASFNKLSEKFGRIFRPKPPMRPRKPRR